MKDFSKIEKLFLDIFGEMDKEFSESEKDEVVFFIQAGEYGLAFETLCDIILEEEKSCSSNAIHMLEEISKEMSFGARKLNQIKKRK